MKPETISSRLDDRLREDGMYDNVTATAVRRVLARQIAREMSAQRLSKTAMA